MLITLITNTRVSRLFSQLVTVRNNSGSMHYYSSCCTGSSVGVTYLQTLGTRGLAEGGAGAAQELEAWGVGLSKIGSIFFSITSRHNASMGIIRA